MLTGALTLSQGYEAKLLKKEPQAHSRHGKKPLRSTAVAAHERVEAAPQMTQRPWTSILTMSGALTPAQTHEAKLPKQLSGALTSVATYAQKKKNTLPDFSCV